MKLSQWHKKGVKPKRKGVYQIDDNDGRGGLGMHIGMAKNLNIAPEVLILHTLCASQAQHVIVSQNGAA